MLSLSFVTGTEPDKWFARYTERTNHGGLHTEASDDPMAKLLDPQDPTTLALVRMPHAALTDPALQEELFVVKLYDEAFGVALPKEHTLTLMDTLTPEDLEGEIVNYAPTDVQDAIDVPAVRAAMQVVAANVGVVYAPRPLLKMLAGKQIEHRGLEGEYRSQIALVWRKADDCDEIQDFVGIAKGRTINSSRQVSVKRSAREKTLAKQAKRAKQQPAQKRQPRRPKRR